MKNSDKIKLIFKGVSIAACIGLLIASRKGKKEKSS
jgi:hypothetical protein